MLKSLAIKWIERYQKKGGERQFAVKCNYKPTCSEYTKQAIKYYGLYQGWKIGFKRIRRCNLPDLIQPIFDPLIMPESLNRGENAIFKSTKSE